MRKMKKWFLMMMCVIVSLGCAMTAEAYSSGKTKDADDCMHGSCTRSRLSGSLYCSSHTCKAKGCYKEVPGANERCATHKTEYYKELGIYDSHGNPKTSCDYSGCSKSRVSGSQYCTSHKCAKKTCTKKVKSGSSYCVYHTCSYPGCTHDVPGANMRCTSHQNAAYPKSSGSTATRSYSNSKSHSSSKTYNIDKSDYSDFEDMYEDNEDDFEGIDDAEDYWNEE